MYLWEYLGVDKPFKHIPDEIMDSAKKQLCSDAKKMASESRKIVNSLKNKRKIITHR